eukprot:TRINITY_DN5092_c0_g1_i1.p1 TRINITY_DN5092_c0_g1~~TRINITY_DN5092_c0_g1_i1.p1  ORF type:complete len:296 (+),score=71.76 TRINITY_DN5092_c0_g1_i1:26-889(+)
MITEEGTIASELAEWWIVSLELFGNHFNRKTSLNHFIRGLKKPHRPDKQAKSELNSAPRTEIGELVLPDDCLLSIFLQLEVTDFFNCRLVNRRWNRVSCEDLLWINLYKSRFNYPPPSSPLLFKLKNRRFYEKSSWKEKYFQLVYIDKLKQQRRSRQLKKEAIDRSASVFMAEIVASLPCYVFVFKLTQFMHKIPTKTVSLCALAISACMAMRTASQIVSPTPNRRLTINDIKRCHTWPDFWEKTANVVHHSLLTVAGVRSCHTAFLLLTRAINAIVTAFAIQDVKK